MKKALFYLAITLLSCIAALSQTQYKILWNFPSTPTDGAVPIGSLILDKLGNLYGTTAGGGNDPSCPTLGGCGTVFELSPNGDGTWSETILYSFCSNYSNGLCLDGAYPQAGLVIDGKGDLYGTTTYGGNQQQNCGDSQGCGTAFKLSRPSPGGVWTEKVLYSFCQMTVVNNHCRDGGFPKSSLATDGAGNLYGTTSVGGSNIDNAGTVFKLSRGTKGWTETVIYNFCSLGKGNRVCPDGALPIAGVTFDKLGNLYGTTQAGGWKYAGGKGLVYKLTPGVNGWTETVVYRLPLSGKEGAEPMAPVVFDSLGNLYGNAFAGGEFGQGVLFKLSPKNGGKVRTYSFNLHDGATPQSALVVDSRSGGVYGSAFTGGTNTFGAIFKMTAPAQETVLYNFCQQQNCADGSLPNGIILDKSGNIFGTTQVGGPSNEGVLFEIIPE